MKQKIVTLIALLVVSISGLVFAQETPAASSADNGLDQSSVIRVPSELYPVRIDVVKVYMHSQGYRVIYRKGQASTAEVYIPSEWFMVGGKAILVSARGPQYPYMVAFYRPDGSFDHVKLYVLKNIKDPSWGVIEGDPGDRFKVESLKLEF